MSNFLIPGNLAVIMFSKFASNPCQRKRKMNEIFTICNLSSSSLIQIQNESLPNKSLKNFKFGTRNFMFGYFRHMLSLNFQKKLSHFTNRKKKKSLVLKTHCVGNFGSQSWDIFSYSESTFLNFSKCKLSPKNKKK